MRIKFFSVIITCFIVTTVFSQSSLNSYKYVIVPSKYDFLKKKDQYQLNSLTQFLFNKYGFVALMEGDTYPNDLAKNRCLALRSDVINESSMFKTKLAVELKNCNDQLVYTSELGESREKDYKKSYMEALRNTFKSLEGLNYKYEPTENDGVEPNQSVEVQSEVAQELKKLKEEIQNLKKEKESEVTGNKLEVVKSETEVEVVSSIKEEASIDTSVKEVSTKMLYAQEIENGFQLVDSSPKVVYRIKRTKLDKVFLVENKSAIIYKKGDDWVLEYYTDDILKQEILSIKF